MFFQSAQGGAAAAVSAPVPVETSPARRATGPVSAYPSRPRLSPWDYAGMLAGFLLTLAITLVNSHGRIFWEDEMLGWLLLRDPSWLHMIRAWNLGADGGGFSFYLLGRPWFRIFGDSVLAFRMFSSTCFGLAFVATWAALRRFYPLWIVFFATFNTFFFSPPLTMHFIEGRFYGLLVMCTAFALWLALVLDDAPDPTPRYLYIFAFLIHAVLTTSHVLGIVYSFFILCATVALDRVRGRGRLGLYLTVAVSWLLLVPEKTSIIAAGQVGKPHFWTKAPTAWVMLGAWTGFSNEILVVLCALLLLACLALRQNPAGLRAALHGGFLSRRAAYVATLFLLLVPFAFLAEGLVGTWLFTDRYLQPVTVGLAYVTAELILLASGLSLFANLRRRQPLLSRAAFASSSVLFTAFTLVWVFHHVSQYTPEAPDFTEQLTAHLPHDLPVVVNDAFTFTGLLGRQAGSGVQYTFLLDWPYAIANGSPRLEVTQYHLMQNWKRAGYYENYIQYANSFLRDHSRFLVIENGLVSPNAKYTPEIGNPLAERLAALPGYEVRKYLTFDRTYHDSVRDTVWLVCRGSCDAEQHPVPTHPDRCTLWDGGETCCYGLDCKLPVNGPPPSVWPWKWKRSAATAAH